jgi:3-deoxy-D-manno-octulosonic-acid transferase
MPAAISLFFYKLVVQLYGFVIHLAAVKKKKAGLWVSGRKQWRQEYKKKVAALGNEKRLWVHCASYGEFEQGRPLMEAIKKKNPAAKIVLSFFSPSGYEAFKNWDGADLVCYLPLDTPKNARDFLNIIEPDLIIFVKYEFWLNFLFEIKKRSIPSYLVSAVFKPRHPFFKWYGSIFVASLSAFNKLFIQDENSAKLLAGIGVNHFEVIGDTRFDRVLEIKQHFSEIPYIRNFCDRSKIIVGGSTWPKDEQLLLETFVLFKQKSIKLILVPHEVDAKSINHLSNLVEKTGLSYLLYSQQKENPNANLLIVDTIGLLSRIYHYADVAYIGGGYNGGLHNTLEAAVYGIPVTFFGKGHENFNEVVELLEIGAGKATNSVEELSRTLETFLFDESARQQITESLDAFFIRKANATQKVIQSIAL